MLTWTAFACRHFPLVQDCHHRRGQLGGGGRRLRLRVASAAAELRGSAQARRRRGCQPPWAREGQVECRPMLTRLEGKDVTYESKQASTHARVCVRAHTHTALSNQCVLALVRVVAHDVGSGKRMRRRRMWRSSSRRSMQLGQRRGVVAVTSGGSGGADAENVVWSEGGIETCSCSRRRHLRDVSAGTRTQPHDDCGCTKLHVRVS